MRTDALGPCVPHQDVRFCGDLAVGGFGSAGANYVRKQKTDKRHDVIAVWKIDRFGRSLMDLANVLADLDSLGVAFVSLRGNFDLSTVRSANVSGHWGDERIRAIAHSGARSCRVRNVVARGVRLRRPKRNEDADEIARLRTSGASWREVSEQMGIGVGTAVRALQQSLQKPHGIAASEPPASRRFWGVGDF